MNPSSKMGTVPESPIRRSCGRATAVTISLRQKQQSRTDLDEEVVMRRGHDCVSMLRSGGSLVARDERASGNDAGGVARSFLPNESDADHLISQALPFPRLAYT
jgi:hypothetical protein